MISKQPINLFLDGNSNIRFDLTQGLQQELGLVRWLGDFLWFVDSKMMLFTELNMKESKRIVDHFVNANYLLSLLKSYIVQFVPRWQIYNHLCFPAQSSSEKKLLH